MILDIVYLALKNWRIVIPVLIFLGLMGRIGVLEVENMRADSALASENLSVAKASAERSLLAAKAWKKVADQAAADKAAAELANAALSEEKAKVDAMYSELEKEVQDAKDNPNCPVAPSLRAAFDGMRKHAAARAGHADTGR